ncbi:hypothetical protein M3Y97_00370500 [Aphelenchoides bicaudatus]|nr:hypothetical protein M3Y97_00370500 [Aphelenchoides bicaudatus]
MLGLAADSIKNGTFSSTHSISQPIRTVQLNFQGGPHPHKAQYCRLSFDSSPSDVLYLMEKVWNIQRPRLIITIHGGTQNFESVQTQTRLNDFNFSMPDRLGKMFREGLLKAAETTGAWIITSGIDSGVVRHVAKALDEAGISARMRSRLVTIGIAPWGVLKKREKLIGRDAQVQYDRHSFPLRSRHAALNDRHTYFLLIDNGTSGRYGADIFFRKKLEDYLAKSDEHSYKSRRVPIVCVAIEGGIPTLNTIDQYLNMSIPTIICEGSGRISNVLSYANAQIDEEGNIHDECHDRVQMWLKELFDLRGEELNSATQMVFNCAKMKNLFTVFRMQENDKIDVDQVILLALLRGQNLSQSEQLSLTLLWNRVDLARTEVFRDDHDQSIHSLNQAMMDALLLNRVDFVKLLLENGVSLKKFLTIARLEKLYNAESSNLSTLSHLCAYTEYGQITLLEIGVAIEKLMDKLMLVLFIIIISIHFISHYTTRDFKSHYEKVRGKQPSMTRMESFHNRLTHSHKSLDNHAQKKKKRKHSSLKKDDDSDGDFKYPFNDLLLWAVLTRRHSMARCMFLYGEQAIAKALVAIRLYKCMSKETAYDYTEIEVSNQLRVYAEEFRDLSIEVLSHCHDQDDAKTMRLLTAELSHWGNHTCLSLAVVANNKRFLAHPCCQILLAELWHGGLRFRSQSNFKVILAVFFPPTILLLDFKTPAQKSSKRRQSITATYRQSFDADAPATDNYNTISNHLSLLLKSTARPRLFSKKSTVQQPVNNNESAERSALLNSQTTNGEPTKRVQIISSKTMSEEVQKDSVIETVGSVPEKKSLRNHLKTSMSKFRLFYGAPITSFWIWTLSFSQFLCTFIYILLVSFPPQVTTIEWFVFAYVVAHGMEHFRKLFVLESSSLVEKIKVFYNRYWNVLTTFAILTYLIGFAFRFHKDYAQTYSRVILASNSVLWHMKLFDFLSVHPRLGPYITMAGKMVLAMSYIIIMLLVTLMSFGVARQSITFPNEKWNWLLVRNIFYKPYFMLYGEVYAGEIDTCGDEGTNCVPGGWIPPVFMTIFLLVANILLINMLIAIFNNIFNVTNAMSIQVWMFQRYEHENTPIIPPPFTPLVHLFQAARALKNRFCCKRSNVETRKSDELDFAIKVYLESTELKELFDFEEDCLDDLMSRRRTLKKTTGATEISTKLDELSEENSALTSTIDRLKSKLDQLEKQQLRMTDLLEGMQEQHHHGEKRPSLKADKLELAAFSNSMRKPKAEVSPLVQSFYSNETASGSDIRQRRFTQNRNSVSYSDDMEQMADLSPIQIDTNLTIAAMPLNQFSTTATSSQTSSTNSSMTSLTNLSPLDQISPTHQRSHSQ